MAMTASACSVKERFTGVRVAHQDVERGVGRSRAQGVAYLLMQKMRQVDNLLLRQLHRIAGRMPLRPVGTNRSSVPCMPNYNGSHQVSPAIAAPSPIPVAGDALCDVNSLSPGRCFFIHDLFVIRAGL